MSYASPPSTYTQSGTGTATLNVYATYAVGPTISAQPQSTREPSGGSATFSVTATGNGTLSYQWKLNGTNVGTNSSSYTRTGLVIADNGTITVDVTDLDGTTTSANASLTVYPTGQLLYRYPLPPRQGPNYGQTRRIAQGDKFNSREGLVTLRGLVGSTAAAYAARLAKTFTPAAGGGTTFLNLAFTALGTLTRQRQVNLSRSFSGVGTDALQRQLNKFTTYSGVGTLSQQKQVNKFFSYAAVGTLAATRLFVKILSFAYSAVGTSTIQKQINKLTAYTAVGANAVQKQINKSFVYSGVGTSGVQKQVNKALAYTATGTLVLTYLLVKLLSLTYTAVGTSTLAILTLIGRAFTYTALGTVALQKQIGKSFSYVAVGTSAVVKQVGKVLNYSGVGTNTFSRLATMSKSFTYTALGTLTFSKTFFGGGGPVIRTVTKAFRYINNRFGRW